MIIVSPSDANMVQSGSVKSVIVKDVTRLSRDDVILDMHYEIFNKTGTNFWHGAVGVNDEEHLRALKGRRERSEEALKKKEISKGVAGKAPSRCLRF